MDSEGSKAGRGRKRKEADDASEAAARDKRQANLEAQRAFQAKKKEYVAQLEQEVASLREIVAGHASSSSSSAKPILNPTAFDSNDIDQLRKLVVVLSAENALMRQSSVLVDFHPKNLTPVSAAAKGKQATASDGNECEKCAAEKIRSYVSLGLVKSLESKIAELQNELQGYRMASQYQQGVSNSNGDMFGLDGLFGFASSQLDVAALLNQTTPLFPPSNTPRFDNPSPNGGNWFDLVEPSHTTNSSSPQPNHPTISPKQAINKPSFQSATDLYGPPECEFARIALKSIPSLANCRHVDELFDAFILQSNSRDKELIKKYGLKTMGLRGKILDACSVMDRQKVIELIVIFLERNKNHVLYRNSMFEEAAKSSNGASSSSTANGGSASNNTMKVDIPQESKRFRNALVSIPSLSTMEASALVDELCHAIWSRNVRGQGKEKLLKIFTMGKKLEKLCISVQDRTK
ncbi:hypothetical protein HDU99_003820, partial [Rhizoclosmatium hyalinum]